MIIDNNDASFRSAAGQALLGDGFEGASRRGGHAHRRMGLLHGLRHHQRVSHLVKFSGKGKFLAGPGHAQDLQSLLEAPLAFGVVDIIALIGTHEAAAADAKVKASAAQLVDGGGFLGNSERIIQRQNIHRQTNA